MQKTLKVSKKIIYSCLKWIKKYKAFKNNYTYLNDERQNEPIPAVLLLIFFIKNLVISLFKINVRNIVKIKIHFIQFSLARLWISLQQFLLQGKKIYIKTINTTKIMARIRICSSFSKSLRIIRNALSTTCFHFIRIWESHIW